MRNRGMLLTLMSLAGAFGASAGNTDQALPCTGYDGDFAADAVFEVYLPQSYDPVTYRLQLQSSTAGADSLAPCSYLIRWATDTAAGESSGFSAYFDGHHYRYRGSKLQEYHAEANDATFRPLGPGSEEKGVQCTAQFADLLPQFVGRRMTQMSTDTAYAYKFAPDTVVAGRRAMVVEGTKRSNGYDVMEYCYVFDPATGLPLKSEVVNSPGSISEQTVCVTYSPATFQSIGYDEASLMEAYPEVFEKYRQSTFRAENLVGSQLPPFACRSLDDEGRYQHHSDQALASTTVIVAIDPGVATASETVQAVRDAVDMLPMQVDVLWAFTGNIDDEATQLLGALRRGEKALMSAGSLTRACGITVYPTTLIVDRTGVVKYVLPGFNNDYGDSVIQKCML